MSYTTESVKEDTRQTGRYTPIPNEIWEMKHLSIQARCIWGYLLSRHGKWKSSCNNLGRNLGIGKAAVLEGLTQLEEYRMIHIVRGTPTCQRWTFTPYPRRLWKAYEPVSDPTGTGLGSDQSLAGNRSRIRPHIRSNKLLKNKNETQAQPGSPLKALDSLPGDLTMEAEELRMRLLKEQLELLQLKEEEASYVPTA